MQTFPQCRVVSVAAGNKRRESIDTVATFGVRCRGSLRIKKINMKIKPKMMHHIHKLWVGKIFECFLKEVPLCSRRINVFDQN